MLIIFDLDDTLLDTSGSVTPFKLKSALKVMLGREGSEGEYQELLAFDDSFSGSKAALKKFAHQNHLSEDSLLRGIESMSSPLEDGFQVKCTPYAKEILKEFHKKAQLAIVSVGYHAFQLDKLKKAGIEEALFSKIVILKNPDKKPAFKELTLSLNPTDVWVCGDRVDIDLKPAHELGFKTVHMRWGRGKNAPPEPWIDYTINRLDELRDIIQ